MSAQKPPSSQGVKPQEAPRPQGAGVSAVMPGPAPSGDPTSPAARYAAVTQQREAAASEVLYRSTRGAEGVAPMARVDAHRQYIARSLGGRNGAPAAVPAIPQGGGQALPGDVRSRMEPRLGADLSGVRFHNSGESAAAAEGLNAKAFTVGQNVHFGSGQYQPGSKEGDRLIAHELAHTVQGQRSGVQRKVDVELGAAHDVGAGEHAGHDGAAGKHQVEHGEAGHVGEAHVSDPAEPAEREADAVADRVTDDLHAQSGHQAPHAAGASTKEAAPAIGAKLLSAPVHISAAAPPVARAIFGVGKKKPATTEATAKPAPTAKPALTSNQAAATTAKPAAQNAASGKAVTTSNATATANATATPATQEKPQVVFNPISVKAAMSQGGVEPIQVRPRVPGGDGVAELWIGNQPGTARLDRIAALMATAKNKTGDGVVAAAIEQILPLIGDASAVRVSKGKVDEAALPKLQATATAAASVVSHLGGQLVTNSLQGADHARPLTKKTRVEFSKPKPEEWKTPYIGEFVAEMVRQLHSQNTGINKLSVDDWLVNRETFSPSEHLNTFDASAKKAVLDKLHERCLEGLPRAEARLKRLQAKKTKLEGALATLQATDAAPAAQMEEAMQKAKEAASDVKSTEADIQGYIDAAPQIAAGQAGKTMDTSHMRGVGGRENSQAAWGRKHKKAKKAIVRLIGTNDPLVKEWVQLVKAIGDLAVLHDPDQIAGGHGDIEALPVVKEPTDPNDSDGHEKFREYLTAVKGRFGVKDINGSLGSQWKQAITGLHDSVTSDPECPAAAYPLRKINAEFVPK